jgi:hypothetical protein
MNAGTDLNLIARIAEPPIEWAASFVMNAAIPRQRTEKLLPSFTCSAQPRMQVAPACHPLTPFNGIIVKRKEWAAKNIRLNLSSCEGFPGSRQIPEEGIFTESSHEASSSSTGFSVWLS